MPHIAVQQMEGDKVPNQNLKHQYIQCFQQLASIFHMRNPVIQEPQKQLGNETVKSALIYSMR